MIDFLCRLDRVPMRARLCIGTADAKGEKTGFQGKKKFFHWRLLFFRGEGAARKFGGTRAGRAEVAGVPPAWRFRGRDAFDPEGISH
jgi:hypothetical protein